MAWEWVAPVGTVIGASITAGFGGWLGGRQSRKTQQRQHEYEKETALTEQGREKAREAIAALRHLQRHQSTVVEWSNLVPAGDLDSAREQHERLGEAIEYFNDETVRREVELVYNALHASYVVISLGHLTIANPELMISRACEEGRAVIGRYLRGEPAQESTFLADLRHAYDSGMDNMQREYEDWERSQQEAYRVYGEPEYEERERSQQNAETPNTD